ncbi:hypothetical protein WJX74_002581 [Apatococcus lobatus]|uniref:Phosphodiesterase n=1 Tax=Apatococcus lobatus TaxID=904363 RepID=A0AAW1RDD0_9CHLO
MLELNQETASRLEVFQALENIAAPAMAARPSPGSAHSGAIWCNAAARKRCGRMYSHEEESQIIAQLPEPVRQAMQAGYMHLYQEILVKGAQSCHKVDPRQILATMFPAVPATDTVADFHNSPLTFEMDGQRHTVLLVQWSEPRASNSDESLRPSIMFSSSPIHSYMFDAKGILLHANDQALAKIRCSGKSETSFHLHELLLKDGIEQRDIAAEARRAIFDKQEKAFRCTLQSLGKHAKVKQTLFEMWPTMDTKDWQVAMLVNTFNVTDQKEMESQLADARLLLLRQNAELEASNAQLKLNEKVIMQEQGRLMAHQQRLQKRLKSALQKHHLRPKTTMDTMTIADKIISALDRAAEGELLPLDDVLHLRNIILEADDLRRPVNLQQQLLHKAGLSMDVGLAMTEMLQGDSNRGANRLARNLTLTTATSSRDFSASLTRSQHLDEPHQEQIALVLIPEVERLLMVANSSFLFDAFELSEATDNHPLSTLGFFLIKGSGLMSTFHIHESQLAQFLQQIEAGYPDNPYHNRIHATCVLQVMHLLMQHGLIQEGILQDVMILACYLAAICHDFEHPGVNNDYLIKTSNRQALTYNDLSPLENHHVAASFMIAADEPAADIFQGIPAEDKATLRASMIDLILGTDMKKHFGLLSRFQALQAQTASRQAEAELSDWSCTKSGVSSSVTTAEHKLLFAQVALKCADIGHLSCPQALHQRWTHQLREEFFQQGDREKVHGLKVSPLMDRAEVTGMTKSQVGFFEIVALPLVTTYVQMVPEAKPMLNAVMDNYNYWHAIGQK